MTSHAGNLSLPVISALQAALVQVVDELSSNISVVDRLQRFQYKDKNGENEPYI
jgi:hypothetical protein